MTFSYSNIGRTNVVYAVTLTDGLHWYNVYSWMKHFCYKSGHAMQIVKHIKTTSPA